MGLTWKVLMPLALANVVIVMTVLQFGFSRWWLLPLSLGLFAAAGLISVSVKRSELSRRIRAPHRSPAAAAASH
jgi:hypothetical protein